MKHYEESELIINPDGSVFHLHLKPGELADRIVLVGDPGRVEMAGSFLDTIEFQRQNREFYSITGQKNGQRLTILSTGIGTDNIDIVMNELDALANIDFNSREDNRDMRRLRLIRIGTSGALQPEIETGSWVASNISLGLDGVMHYYPKGSGSYEGSLIRKLVDDHVWPEDLPLPYAFRCGESFTGMVAEKLRWGITASAHGFYAPQGRSLRAGLSHPQLNEKLASFSYKGLAVTNFEMESSALYGLSSLLGHEALTVCLIVANRIRKEFLSDYKPAMEELLEHFMNHLTKSF